MSGAATSPVQNEQSRNGTVAGHAESTPKRLNTARQAIVEYTDAIRGIPGLEFGVFSVHGNLIKGVVVANHISFPDRARVSEAETVVSNSHPKLLWDLWLTDRKDSPSDLSVGANSARIDLTAQIA